MVQTQINPTDVRQGHYVIRSRAKTEYYNDYMIIQRVKLMSTVYSDYIINQGVKMSTKMTILLFRG